MLKAREVAADGEDEEVGWRGSREERWVEK